MATRYYTGKASKTAQVSTATVGGTLSVETFTISVGGVIIATHTDADTVIATTVAALVSAWNDSTHPYATGVTATDDSPVVTLTADTAGVPFVITINTPGGSATFATATPTANSGPNVLDLADNWDGSESLPGGADVLHFADGTIPICWGLDGLSGITFGNIFFHQNYTGRFGLNYQSFATSADGSTVNTTVAEYRNTHLELKCGGTLTIGINDGPIRANGSPRLLLDVGNQATSIDILDTANLSADAGRHVVRLRANDTNVNVYIRKAPGGVGIGTDVPGETSVFGVIRITNNAPLTCLYTIGLDVEYEGLIHAGGTGLIWQGPTGTNIITVENGILTTEGVDDYDVDVLTVLEGATLLCNHVGAPAVSTLHIYGTVDTLGSQRSRSITSAITYPTGVFKNDPERVIITSQTEAK